ncbi:MAG: hypothetical protein NTW87_20245 [Planctomycetota bacterium]|nr:hypothetical protein [Planctomycetota bacterium]
MRWVFTLVLATALPLCAAELVAPPSEEQVLVAVRECGVYDYSTSHRGWDVIQRLPEKERARLLETHLTDKDVAVDHQYLSNLAVWSAEAPSQFILGTWQEGSTTIGGVPVDSRDQQGRSRYEQALQRLAAALGQKEGDPFLQSFVLVCAKHADPDAAKHKLRFAEAFAHTSDVTRDYLFRWAKLDWKMLASEPLLQTVRSLVNEPLPDSGQRKQDAVRRRKALALQRYYELEPESARAIILDQMRKVEPDFEYSGLLLLPDRELPELTEDFRAILKSSGPWWNSLPCISRYGVVDLLPDVTAWYAPAKGRWACVFQTAALRFIVEHDRPAGLAAVREAMTFRGEKCSRCYTTVLQDVLAGDHGKDVTAMLVEALHDPEDEVAKGAAQLLSDSTDGLQVLKAQMVAPGKLSPKVHDRAKALVDIRERYKR